MLTSSEYIRQSLELHLFFARIMKEHAFFLQVGFTPKDIVYSDKADYYRNEFDDFLGEIVQLSNGVVRSSVLQSGEVITPYTLNAETVTSNLTGVELAMDITKAEANLVAGDFGRIRPEVDQRINYLNQKAITLISGIIEFKTKLLADVLSCKTFTVNYPLLLDHILREAKLYLQLVQRLQQKELPNIEMFALEQETFWNRIMAEHSKFIRGLLDPTEKELFDIADQFGNQFDQLTQEAIQALNKTIPLEQVTNDSLQETIKIRDFKIQGTKGLLECKIKSIIIPLLADHTLREANHYLRLLETFSKRNRAD